MQDLVYFFYARIKKIDFNNKIVQFTANHTALLLENFFILAQKSFSKN